MSGYVNIHGQPVNVSARDAVVQIEPKACARAGGMLGQWRVFSSPHPSAAVIGVGSTEETAWREAWSRILAEEVQRVV